MAAARQSAGARQRRAGDDPPAASQFKHRGEFVYLPPAWFAAVRAPRLPTVMMIGGEFNTPADWLRAGNAIKTIDDFAAAHGGSAPVLVFVDSGGAFNTDTECVNGMRGNSADHLTKDVVPFMDVHLRGQRRPGQLGRGRLVHGRHVCGGPDRDASGACSARSWTSQATSVPRPAPRTQTIARLFGGNADAWAAFDPATVIVQARPLPGVAGWFDISSSNPPKHHRSLTVTGAGDIGLSGQDIIQYFNDQTVAAESLCELGRANGINCAVVAQPGKHDWPFASNAFAAALPWLAGRLGTPGVPWTPLPSTRPPAEVRRRRGTPSPSAGKFRLCLTSRTIPVTRPLVCRRSIRFATRSRAGTRHQ